MTKKTFKTAKTNDTYRGIFTFEFDEGSKQKGSGAIPDTIHLIPTGQWEHDMYGPIIITASDIREFIQNFNAEVRKGVFITAGHEGYQELPAVGWVTKVEQRDDGLWGEVEWNEGGIKALKNKEFKFFSPEMCRDYEDPETHQFYRNVLTGGALTKSPYFKELQAIVFSDKQLQANFNEQQTMTKTLEEILAIEDITTLTDEEKAVLVANKETLTDDQKVKYTAIIDAPAEETPAPEPTDAPATDAPAEETPAPAEEAPATDTPADAGTQTMSDKNTMVQINASELAILREKANQGAQAFKELEKAEIDGALSKMTFSATNAVGKFLPKSTNTLRAFMESLNKAQRTQFSALVAEIPENNKFSELGAGFGAGEGTTLAEVDAKVATLMKANEKMSYADALRQVFAENDGLELRYTSELPSAKKGA